MTSTQFGLRYLEIDTFKQDDGIRKNMPPPDKHNVLERVLIHDGRGLHFNSSFDQCKNLKEFTVLSDSTGASNKEATYSSYLFRTYAPQLFYINNTGNSKYKMSGEVFYNVGSNAGSDRGKIVLKGKWYNSSSYPFGSSSPTQGYKAESLIADTQDGTIQTGIYGGLSAKWINNPNKEPNKNHVHTGTSSNSWTGLNKMFYYNNKIEDMIVYLPNADRTSVADHNMESMFSGCKGLREVEIKSPYYAVKPEDMSDMFNNATSLERVTLSGLGWDLAAQAAETSRKLDMERMFANCVALTYEGLPSQIKDLNLSSGVGNSSTQLDQMFNGAVNLRKPIDLTVTGSMACSFANLISNFYNETNILKIDGDNFDFSGITNSTTMGNVYIGYMPSLVSFTGVDFSSVGTGGGLLSFVNDVSLVEVDGLVYPSAANMFNMSFEKTNMSGSALDAVFTDVPDLTGQTARTITITNAKGAADCDTSIATAKNYTVTN